MTLPVPVRNRLAQLVVDAFDRAEPRRTLAALAGLDERRVARAGSGAAGRLTRLGWVEAAEGGGLRLRGVSAAQAAALRRRVRAARAALRGSRPSPAPALPDLLRRAACLADHGLHFEVHELLEPVWLRADGEARVALQGLIQVAVALEHAANGNRAGAISLLGGGLAKLSRAGRALPLAVEPWARELGRVLAALRAGAPGPAVPPWPRPGREPGRSGPHAAGEPAWRCVTAGG